MSIEATYHSEVRFVRSAHSSKTGTTITLALPDSDELSKVAGFDGKRYMLALVEIGDDEQPVQRKPEPEPEKLKGGHCSKWLALRCQEPMFQQFIGSIACGADVLVTNADTAAQVARHICGVKSRADIDNDKMAFTRFETLIRLPYQKWCVTRGVRFTAPEYANE